MGGPEFHLGTSTLPRYIYIITLLIVIQISSYSSEDIAKKKKKNGIKYFAVEI